MTNEELEKRLAARKKRIEAEEAEKRAQAEQKRKEQMDRFLSLKESVKKDLELGRMVIDAVICFPHNTNGLTRFITDSVRHDFGFYYIFGMDWKGQIGWENGGACGEWDVMYDPSRNENEILTIHRKTKASEFADERTIRRFCDMYEQFHEEFHKWLDTIE